MAVPNMIVTLAMNATKYASGLKRASTETTAFGRFTSRAFDIAKTAFIGLTLSAIRMIPVLAQMGAESRKADIQLKFMLENMQGVGKATDATIKRMNVYAQKVNVATAVDDEQVKAVQRKLLVFKQVRKSADVMGGAFDRATSAAIDLAAGGFGTMETNAIKLGKVLSDPTANLNALTRAGITFTNAEKAKISKLQESGKLYEAQDLVLQSIEGRVKGLAEKSATPAEKLAAQFQQIGDTIGEAMLPALDDMNKKVSKWLSTPQGRQDVQAIADAFVAAAYGVRDMAKFLVQVRNLLDQIKPFTDLLKLIGDTILQRQFGFLQLPGQLSGTNTGGHRGGGGGGGVGASVAPIINFNTPIDSVSAGREIARVLSDYDRASGRRR
jgi:hypothetical protein